MKPCPCGETPTKLLIDGQAKWARACGDCCNDWSIEFRTGYHPHDSEECQALAVEAWNLAKRGIPKDV